MQITRHISTKAHHKAVYTGKVETSLTFDFTEVTPAEIAGLATKSSSMVVDFQAKVRASKTAAEFKKWGGDQVIKVRDLIDNRTTRRTAEEKLVDMLASADPAKLRELLAERGINVE